MRWLRVVGICLLWPVPALADPPPANDSASQPSLELGIGLGGLYFPDYPGAGESRKLLLPFPYIVYHGPHLDVTQSRVRGIVLAQSRFSLDVDFDGAVSVASADTRERRGMPDLDWIGEAGPALRYHVWSSEGDDSYLDAVLPARAAVSARGMTVHDRGWAWAPRIEYDHIQGEPAHAFEFDASFWTLWNDAKLNDYVYGVTPQFAGAGRPTFEPGGGYSGYTLDLGLSLHQGSLVYGCFLRYTNLNGAVFAASPLVTREQDVSVGLAVSWVIQSSRSP